MRDVVNDKKRTAQYFGDTSNVMAVAAMNSYKTLGQPIDIMTMKDEMEAQMRSLVESGTEREKQIAQLVIMAQKAAETLMTESMSAPTSEAKAMILEKATKIMEKTTKMIEKLDAMTSPKTGRVIESVPDKQLPNKTKSPSEQTTGRE